MNTTRIASRFNKLKNEIKSRFGNKKKKKEYLVKSSKRFPRAKRKKVEDFIRGLQ